MQDPRPSLHFIAEHGAGARRIDAPMNSIADAGFMVIPRRRVDHATGLRPKPPECGLTGPFRTNSRALCFIAECAEYSAVWSRSRS